MFIASPVFYSIEPFIHSINTMSSQEIKNCMLVSNSNNYRIKLTGTLKVSYHQNTISSWCIVYRNNIPLPALIRYKNKTCRILVLTDLFVKFTQFLKSFKNFIK